jgi:electron transport complex protein RnfG
MWDSIVKPTLVLFVVCLVISGSLAFVNDMTKDTIEENTRAEQEGFRCQVLQEADKFEPVDQKWTAEEVKNVYAAFNGDKPVGFVMDIEAKGYGGTIGMTVGINTDGEVTGVIIGLNNETPGLGSKVTEPDFLNQFIGIGIKDILENGLEVVKQNKKQTNEIQAVSGATISSRGVTSGVQVALDTFAIVKGGD